VYFTKNNEILGPFPYFSNSSEEMNSFESRGIYNDNFSLVFNPQGDMTK